MQTKLKKASVSFFTMLIALLLAFTATVSMAEEDLFADEYGPKYLVADSADVNPDDILEFKDCLYEMGFYVSSVGTDTLLSKELDNVTMAAVYKVCQLNPELFTYNAAGVSNLMFWYITGVDGYDGLNTPEAATYSDLQLGDEGTAVTKVQNRLDELGYDGLGYQYTSGVYDDALQSVIKKFAKLNNFSLDEDGVITAEMQEQLFSDDAVAYTPTVFEKIQTYFRTSTELFGLDVPNLAIWGVGFVLLCVIVLLIVMLSGPKKTDESNMTKSNPTATGGIDPGDTGLVFTVNYGGKTNVYHVQNTPVEIGRAHPYVPIDKNDLSAGRHHCEIFFSNGKCFLRDHSKGGTTVNGTLYQNREKTLHSGDILGIGEHTIRVEFKD